MSYRLLAAFDFDHTVVEENSDIVARKLISIDLIPEDVRRQYKTQGWTTFMSEIFKLLHANNVSKETIVDAMHQLTPTPQMPELLKWLKDERHEVIIISDSNSVFISEWLQHNKLIDCVREVFTNPAKFENNGLLTIQPYHSQDWCGLSTKNLCKGFILQSYIEERKKQGKIFDVIMYVGDGNNDFCPALKLSERDFVFARAGYPLEKMIQDMSHEKKVVAKVYSWTSATEIKNIIQDSL